MKKKTMKIAMVAVVAAVAGYVTYQNQAKEIGMSELALANVEALAQDYETPDGRKLYEHHCGDSPGTQCKPLGVTGNPCPVERSCP